jgi:hypothetical protein
MKYMRSLSTEAFKTFCQERVAQFENYYTKEGILNKDSKINSELIEENFKLPYYKWDGKIHSYTLTASRIAAAYEYLHNTQKAKLYYWVGSNAWNLSEIDFTPTHETSPPIQISYVEDMFWKDNRVHMQLKSAICNDRIANRERAKQLYGWVAELRKLSDAEYEKFIRTFRGPKQYNDAWGRKVERTYALVGLERWEEALAEAEGAEKWIARDPRPRGDHAWRNEFWLLQSLRPLIEYKLEPTAKNKAVAKKGLKPNILKSEDHSRTLTLFFYLFNLREKCPELA